MKILLCAMFCSVCFAASSRAQAPASTEGLVGSYRWMMVGGTWTLILKDSGAYTLAAQGSVASSKPELIEHGAWTFDSHQVVLKTAAPPMAGTEGEYRQLSLRREADGDLALVSVRKRDYVFVRVNYKEPNQPPEPMRMSVTPAACAAGAPATRMAHL